MKNNKLIAEFMGAYFDDKGMTRLCGKFGLERVSALNLKYHSSWDWLMPVVEKIESDERYDVDILQYGTKITDNQKEIVNNIADISFDKKIDHTYDAVVKFINQYNFNESIEEFEEVSIFDFLIDINK